jgi:hypothetical protein
MSRHITCDFCGGELSRYEQDNVIAGALLGRGYEWAADYHPHCWERIVEVIRMVQEFEGPLASIPVASQQGIAAKKRKHTKPEQDKS